MSRQISKHFHSAEMECPCCGLFYLDERLLQALEMARQEYGKPMVINSGCRCLRHNEEIGGDEHSAHITIAGRVKGRAVDIRCMWNEDRHKMLSALLRYFWRIGIARSYIHVDVEENYPKPRLWIY